jgi:hypothetical protein
MLTKNDISLCPRCPYFTFVPEVIPDAHMESCLCLLCGFGERTDRYGPNNAYGHRMFEAAGILSYSRRPGCITFVSLRSQKDVRSERRRVLNMNVGGAVATEWLSLTRWDAAAKTVKQIIGHRRHLSQLEMLLSTVGPSRFDGGYQGQRFIMANVGPIPSEVPDIVYLQLPQQAGNSGARRRG